MDYDRVDAPSQELTRFRNLSEALTHEGMDWDWIGGVVSKNGESVVDYGGKLNG